MIMVAAAYRGDDDFLRARIAEILEDHGHEVEALGDAARGVVARRAGRVAAGAVGMAGGLLVLGLGFVGAVTSSTPWWGFGGGGFTPVPPTMVLCGAWPAMGVAYVLGRLSGRAWIDRALRALPGLSGRLREDLSRLERARSPRGAIVDRLERAEARSIGWPLAALGLLMPLTLHLVVWFCLAGPGRWVDFDGWIRLSALYVGLAHLVLAAGCLRLGRDLRWHRAGSPAAFALGQSKKLLGFSALAACLPGVVLLAIPPILTAVTALAFLPLACHRAGRRLAAERAALGSLHA
jgi:hypothetical protein